MDTKDWIILGAVVFAVVLLTIVIVLSVLHRRGRAPAEIENDRGKIDAVLAYVENQKREADEKAAVATLKKQEQKQKLEYFKQTRDELKDSLRAKLNLREWVPLSRVLNSMDKGTVGIYVLYNQTKNKYYVGQAKALTQRIKKHFEVEEIARDFLSGDSIAVKTLTASELGSDYRVDHIEKVGIEIFDADKSGYNKTVGNI